MGECVDYDENLNDTAGDVEDSCEVALMNPDMARQKLEKASFENNNGVVVTSVF